MYSKSLLLGSMAALMTTEAEIMRSMQQIQITPVSDFRRKSTYRKGRTGKKYPFSSKRQNDRFARQLAAGKVKFA